MFIFLLACKYGLWWCFFVFILWDTPPPTLPPLFFFLLPKRWLSGNVFFSIWWWVTWALGPGLAPKLCVCVCSDGLHLTKDTFFLQQMTQNKPLSYLYPSQRTHMPSIGQQEAVTYLPVPQGSEGNHLDTSLMWNISFAETLKMNFTW